MCFFVHTEKGCFYKHPFFYQKFFYNLVKKYIYYERNKRNECTHNDPVGTDWDVVGKTSRKRIT